MVTSKQIRDLYSRATAAGDDRLMTLCEIALGGSGSLNKIALAAVAQEIASRPTPGWVRPVAESVLEESSSPRREELLAQHLRLAIAEIDRLKGGSR